MVDPYNLIYGFVLGRLYDLLRIFYQRTKPFPLTLKTGMVEMHAHGGKYELMFPQIIGNEDLRKTEIKRVTHELGYPKLEKISKERGSHTNIEFSFILEGDSSKSIHITYNMGEGIPKKCKLKTIVEHRYGINKYIEDIDISFK